MIPFLMAESKDKLKSLLRMKEESEKAGLKFIIQKTKNMASSHIILWQTHGEKGEIGTLFSWASKSLWTVTTTMKLKDAYSLEQKPQQT